MITRMTLNPSKPVLYAAAAVILLFITGCNTDEKVPPVSEANCQPQFVKTLKTDRAKKALGDACFLQQGKYNLAPGKAW